MYLLLNQVGTAQSFNPVRSPYNALYVDGKLLTWPDFQNGPKDVQDVVLVFRTNFGVAAPCRSHCGQDLNML